MEKNIFTKENEYEKVHKHIPEPIRGSIAVLIAKIAITLFLLELIYGIAYYLLNIGFTLPFNLHHHIAEVFLFLDIFKLIIGILIIAIVILAWANNIYFITEKHLIQRRGIFHIEEDVFHLSNIRSISISQSVLGKNL